ncbi:MAG: 3-dehydroquinate dehydratase [Clostridia bacterium]|nr:3-dehydroquinate dehydratase [Clostridia bacterium]
MKLIVINGPNINMLGRREPHIYGQRTYAELVSFIKESAVKVGVDVTVVQYNCEGDIVTEIQNALGVYDGIIINAAAYTHTSIAIADALRAVDIPTVSVHLTDINNREPYRKIDFIAPIARLLVVGKGFDGYKEALEFFVSSGV